MDRRKKTKNKSILSGKKSARREDFRFSVSLIILSAMLLLAALLFLLALNFPLSSVSKRGPVASEKSSVVQGMPLKASGRFLEEDVLDYSLTMPFQLGDWMYKIGFVKSLTDDSLSNQYVKIYVPLNRATGSNNFEKKYQDILTIRKFTSGEWKELEKGCDKKNLVYCEEAGTKIAENDGSVYAYAKSGKCSSEIATKCRFIDEIIKS